MNIYIWQRCLKVKIISRNRTPKKVPADKDRVQSYRAQ